MNYQTRQNLIQKLLNNYQICNIKNKDYLVYNPTAKVLYGASILYKKLFEKLRFSNWIRQEKCLQLLIDKGLWNTRDKLLLENYYKQVDNYKIGLYQQSYKIKEVNKLRKSLRFIEQQINLLLNRRHQLDDYTLEYYLQSRKLEFILLNTTVVKATKEKLNNKDVSFSFWQQLRHILQQRILSQADYRELARNEPWQTYWQIGKPNPFSFDIMSLSEEQQTLIKYSQMYDRVYEAYERPSDNIIHDDDMLDGWILLQIQQQNKDRTEKQIDKQTGGKIQGSGEVFLMADGKEDAKNIQLMNSQQAQIVKQQRKNLIAQRGEVKDAQFLDKQLELRQQSNKQFKNKG